MTHFKLNYIPFPAELRGSVFGLISCAGRVPRIVIDSSQDTRTQEKALRHELAHLMLGHADNQEADLRQLEAEADAAADRMTEEDLEALMQWAI